MRTNLLLFLIITFLSCNYEKKEFYSFVDDNWILENKVRFNINVVDSNSQFIQNICLRHTTSYKYQNLIFFLHHEFNNLIHTDTLELYLAEDNGRWLGTGKGDIKEFSIKIQQPEIYKFGNHSFIMELAMRDNTNNSIKKLEKIKDISFFLTNNNE